MNKNEFGRFCEAWASAQELGVNGKLFSKAAMTALFEDLECYPLEDINQALICHRRQNKYAPSVNDIIEILSPKATTTHIGSEEAWTIAVNAFDENNTVVITQEMFDAKVAAQPVWDLGDEIGARMAFKEVYNRKLMTAGPVKWFVSAGIDKTQTAHVVKEAIAMGRLPKGAETKYLQIEATTTSNELIEQALQRTGKDKALANIRVIKSMLNTTDDGGIARREQERKAFEAKRQAIVDAAMEKLREETKQEESCDQN